MGKVVIDQKLLGTAFMDVVFIEANKLAEEKGINKDKVAKELATAQTPDDFMQVIKDNFGEELVIRLSV